MVTSTTNTYCIHKVDTTNLHWSVAGYTIYNWTTLRQDSPISAKRMFMKLIKQDFDKSSHWQGPLW